jgi:hypothetical protein
MVLNAEMWLQDTLTDCCSTYYSRKLKECVATASASSGKYYPGWESDKDVSLIMHQPLPLNICKLLSYGSLRPWTGVVDARALVDLKAINTT